MAVIEELIRKEEDGTVSFGNYLLKEKSKKDEFEYAGDIYKVKTFEEITKLERNGMFEYESVPGTAVNHFQKDEKGVSFQVEADGDVQITLGLAEDREYRVKVDQVVVGSMKTGMSGKLTISVGKSAEVEVTEA